MNELLKSATRMFDAIAAVAEYALIQEKKKVGDTSPAPARDAAAEPETHNPMDPPSPKTRKPRATPKEEKAPAPEKPAVPEMTEQESLDELYKVSAAYIQKTPVAAEMEARKAVAVKHLAEVYKTDSIKTLGHTQRVQFISWLKTGIAAA